MILRAVVLDKLVKQYFSVARVDTNMTTDLNG